MGILDKFFGPPNIEKLKKKGDVDGLIKALSHEDADVRSGAATALGDLGDPRAVHPLMNALRRAIMATARLNLFAVAEDKNFEASSAAKEALLKIGEPAVELFIAVLKDKNEHLRMRSVAASALDDLGDSRAVEPLIDLLKAKHQDVFLAETAVLALGKLGDSRAVAPLIATLKWSGSPGESVVLAFTGGSNEAVRSKAVWALERIGGPEAERALAEYRSRQK